MTKRRWLFAIGLALVAALPLLPMGGGASAATPTTYKLKAGGGETGYAVNEFLPNTVTILTGDIVHWDFTWNEPHTVTFGTPAGDPTVSPNPFPTAPVQYDGTGSITSGLISPTYPPGPPGTPHHTSYEVQFTKAGDYNFFCAIHPNMKGDVKVIDSGTTSKQADLDAAGATQYASGLAALKAAAQATSASPISVTTNADGSKLYGVHVSTLQDVLQGDVQQYFPPTLNITAGDSVKWVSTVHTPHTVTFGPPPQSDPFTQSPTVPSAGYDGTGLANSAIIGIDQGPNGTTFQLKFTKAGTYTYVCELHANQGMQAQVVVAAAPAPPATPSPTTAPGAPKTGSGTEAGSSFGSIWLLAGALAVSMAMGSMAVYAARRR